MWTRVEMRMGIGLAGALRLGFATAALRGRRRGHRRHLSATRRRRYQSRARSLRDGHRESQGLSGCGIGRMRPMGRIAGS